MAKRLFILLFITVIFPVFSQEIPIKLPGIQIFRQQKQIWVMGVVNQTLGPIELLATTAIGKTHESVLVLECSPQIFQSALLLLGLNPGGGGKYQGDTVSPYGDAVFIYVEWQENNQTKRVYAEELVWDCKKNTSMQLTHWVFTGSRFIRNSKNNIIFAANPQGILIATYFDPDAILNNPLPERVDDSAYEANFRVIPPKGTPVKVILSKVK